MIWNGFKKENIFVPSPLAACGYVTGIPTCSGANICYGLWWAIMISYNCPTLNEK